jgi:signal transduction histidine kinase
MASGPLKPETAAGTVPSWRVPKVLLVAAFRSSSLLGHDLVNRLMAERFQLFLAAYLAMYSGAGVLLPLWEYEFVQLRSRVFLAIAVICSAQCAVLVAALRLVRRGRHQQSITLACIGNWAALLLITFIGPNLLAATVLGALVPVVFAEPYIRGRRGLIFTLITAGCVLALAVIARFLHFLYTGPPVPRWIDTAFIMAAVPINAFHLLVIAWNNAAALRTSKTMLAERAAQVEASRSRLVTAADEERRRLERDLHDGAQQHLVSLSVLLQLARTGEQSRRQPLLTESSKLLEAAIAEIRRLAHGIYPPLLVSGGLAQALPAIAAHAPIPVQLNLQGLARYPTSIEAALYFCCREALHNSAKHGGPDTTATITAHADDRMLTLTISDTGRGFDPATSGTGLTNMTDRLSAIGGNLVIDTAPGRGTRVTAVVTTPVQASRSDGESTFVSGSADQVKTGSPLGAVQCD